MLDGNQLAQLGVMPLRLTKEVAAQCQDSCDMTAPIHCRMEQYTDKCIALLFIAAQRVQLFKLIHENYQQRCVLAKQVSSPQAEAIELPLVVGLAQLSDELALLAQTRGSGVRGRLCPQRQRQRAQWMLSWLDCDGADRLVFGNGRGFESSQQARPRDRRLAGAGRS